VVTGVPVGTVSALNWGGFLRFDADVCDNSRQVCTGWVPNLGTTTLPYPSQSTTYGSAAFTDGYGNHRLVGNFGGTLYSTSTAFD
jgi:hypothetical protein